MSPVCVVVFVRKRYELGSLLHFSGPFMKPDSLSGRVMEVSSCQNRPEETLGCAAPPMQTEIGQR